MEIELVTAHMWFELAKHGGVRLQIDVRASRFVSIRFKLCIKYHQSFLCDIVLIVWHIRIPSKS